MASGHVNRANRPNTWLHRPICKREESSCQIGAVQTWHDSDEPITAGNVRSSGHSGHADWSDSRNGTYGTTPAMAAKVTERLWEMSDIVDVLEAWKAANP